MRRGLIYESLFEVVNIVFLNWLGVFFKENRRVDLEELVFIGFVIFFGEVENYFWKKFIEKVIGYVFVERY